MKVGIRHLAFVIIGCSGASCQAGSKAVPSEARVSEAASTGSGSRAALAPPSGGSSAAEPAAPAPSIDSSLPNWRLGEQRKYESKLASSASVDQQPLTQFVLTGRLVVTAVEITSERLLMHARLELPKFATTLPGKQVEFAQLAPSLAEPFLVEFKRGGAVAKFYFSDQPSSLIIAVREQLASALQVVNGVEVSAWSSRELDGTGLYEAAYERTSEAGHLKKRKLRYLKISGAPPGTEANTQIRNSDSSVWLTDSHVVERVEATEELEVKSSLMTPIVSSTVISLRGDQPRVVASAQVSMLLQVLPRSVAFDEDHAWRTAIDPAQNDAARIGTRTWASVLAVLNELSDRSPPDDAEGKEAFEQQRSDTFGALEAMLRSQPGAVARAVDLIRHKRNQSSVMLDALGSSGSPDAQKALLSLIQGGTLDAVSEKSAAISLSRTPRPTLATTQGLIAMMANPRLRTQALYGLGTCTRRLAEAGEAKRAHELLLTILASLHNDQSRIGQITALRAIANSGQDKALSAVKALLSAPDDDVRAAATESLQLMQQPDVDALLASALLKDPAQTVRLAATRAIKLRAMSSELRSAVTTASESEDAHVRLAAIRVLISWLPSQRTLRPHLERLAGAEREGAIAQELKTALAAHNG